MTALDRTLIITTCLLINGCANTIYMTDDKPDTTSRFYYLPKGVLHLTIERKEDNSAMVFTLTPNFIADTQKLFYLHRDHSLWYEDKYVIETDQYGLLKAINTTTTFKGQEIVKKMGEIAGGIAQVALESPTTKACKPKKFTFEIDIDPYKDKPDDINNLINDKCASISYIPLTSVPASNDKDKDTIFYRHSIGFSVTVKSYDTSDTSDHLISQKTMTVGLPDATKVEKYKISRGYFVDRDIKLSFTNGVLTKDESTYPSEILGFISLPLEAINGISNAITGRFGMKTKELQNETIYLNAQKSRDDALNKQ